MSNHMRLLSVLVLLSAVAVGCVVPVATPAPEAPAEAAEAPAAAEEPAEVSETEEITLKVVSYLGATESEAELLDTLDREFEAAHPGVTVNREYMEFGEWQQVSQLRLSSPEGPDVFPANNGESDMGPLVRAGLLLDLTPYAEELGWYDEISGGLLDRMSYTSDGKQFGEGNLYGMAPLSEVVGVFYNKQKFADAGAEIPKTFEELEALFETFKEQGETPIMLGNLDGWPATHVLGEIANSLYEDRQWLDDFIYARNNVSFEIPENVEAARILMDWVDKGYFLDGFTGIGYDDAVSLFASGEGVMFIAGDWIGRNLYDAGVSDNFGFFLVPPRAESGWKMSVGSLSIPFAVRADMPHPQLAVEYMDWMISDRATELWMEQERVPTVPNLALVKENTIHADVAAAWSAVNENDGVGHYQDWASPTMFDTDIAAIQEMLAHAITPEEFVQKIEKDYAAYLAEKGQ